MKNIFTKNQKGYALLFTVVIVSAVAVLSAGLTNAVYKQMVLSSLAKDSQLAFYQADTASECALYSDIVEYDQKYLSESTPPKPLSIFDIPIKPWSCGGNTALIITPKGLLTSGYIIEPTEENAGDPCFRIDITKEPNGIDGNNNPIIKVVVRARGYNICDKTNPRTVEREIETDYNQ